MKITGMWTLDRALNQWGRVLVHLPSLGAHTRQATYKISLGNGTYKYRTILQRTMKNGWISLGVFPFSGTPKVELTTETLDGDAPDPATGEVLDSKNEDIAFDAIAFEPLPAKPSNIVVALGDSYSAGEGGTVTNAPTYSYYQESDFYGSSRLMDTCHRSPYTWSRVALLPDSATAIGTRADNLDISLDYHLLACSGAVVHNVLPTGVRDSEGQLSEGQNSELAQLEQGFLDENTTLVTISIGGNDAKFGPIITKCLTLPLCEFTTQGAPEHITGPVTDSVVIALREIRKKAPNARVMLMGYPPLLSGTPGACVPGIDEVETFTLNSYADLLQAQLSIAAGRANSEAATNFVTTMNPASQFAGKTICGTPESVHGVISKATPGEPPFKIVSQQSFHPKIEGYQLYANVLTNALKQ